MNNNEETPAGIAPLWKLSVLGLAGNGMVVLPMLALLAAS